MKFFLFTFLAAAAVLSAQASLKDDFHDIGKLVPVDKVKALVAKHMFLDKQFQDFVKFLKTDEFAGLWDQLMSAGEFRQIVTYVTEGGYDLAEGLNKLAAILKVNPYPTGESTKLILAPRTVNSFLKELLQVLPQPEIRGLMKSKMISSPEWKTFVTHLNKPEFTTIVNSAMSAQSTAAVRQNLEKRGLNLKRIIEGALDVLKWSY